MPATSLGSRFRVGAWTVFPDECRIRCGTREAHLRPLLMDLLVLLVNHAGTVVSKEQIFDGVWQRQYVTESALTRSVAELRASLGDTLSPPRYLETVSKRGYRLVAPVSPCEEQARPRVAVIPFESLTRSPDDEYICDGLVDALITALGKHRELWVISRHSVKHLKHVETRLADITRELHVDALVTGTVLHVGPNVRVSAQLVRVLTDEELWADRFEAGTDDVLSLQDRLAADIARAVAGVLVPPAEARDGGSASALAARQAYVKARQASDPLTVESLKTGLEHLHRATKADPLFAPAYEDLASTLVTMGFWGYLPPAEAYAQAEEAASIALALDDSLSEGHAALGLVRLLKDWDLRAAEIEFRHAIALNPSNASAHMAYALFLAAAKHDAVHATEQVQAALETDPLSVGTASLAGWIFLFVGDLDHASGQALAALALHPNALHGHYVLGWTEGRGGRWDAAVAHFRHAAELSRDPITIAYLGHALARDGCRAEATAMIDELHARARTERVPPYCFAVLHAGLGEVDQAFAFLDKCYEERESRIFWLPATPASDLLRDDPRFASYVKRLGLGGN